MYARKLLITLASIMAIISLSAQTIQIQGQAVSRENNIPLPNISIFTEKRTIGTISDIDGKFSITLPSQYINSYLYFTGIGYKKDSMQITKNNVLVAIQLKPEIYQLKEVYIIPDSTLLTLLRKAYHKIIDNYPNAPTLYEGFYREYKHQL